ncbi:hypothetical protein ABZP36_023180 [Zizania latifolia]
MEKLGQSSSMAASLTLSASVDGTEVPDDMEVVEMQFLFEKVLMPSDISTVAEQLVIPEEHIGKLDVVVRDPEGFMAIIFEDGAVAGKLWRFRYWNRNNVHCMAKGWGSFHREKGLSAGDTVSFFRNATRGRLFIFYKRRARASSSDMLRPGLSAVPLAAQLVQLYHGQTVPPVGLGAGTPATRDVVPSSVCARLRLGNDTGGGAPPSRLPASSSSRHATLRLSNVDIGGGAGALARHASSSGYDGSPLSKEVGGGRLAKKAPSSGHVEEQARRAPPRRRRRGTAHLEPAPMIENPPILESMLLVNPPSTAKRVRLFGVYIDGPPAPRSGGLPKKESFP